MTLGEITVFGVTHPSVAAAADHVNVPFPSVAHRLSAAYRSVWTRTKRCDVAPSPQAINRAFLPAYVIVKSQVFRNPKLAAEYYEIPANFRHKVLALDSIKEQERALNMVVDPTYRPPGAPRRILPFFAKGAWHRCMNEACKQHGVDQQTVIRKLRALENPSQEHIDALFDPPATHTRNPEPITVNGVRYRSITAACKALGMRQNTVDGRLKRIPVRSPFWINACFSPRKLPKAFRYDDWKRDIIVCGERYSTIEEASETLGANAPTVRSRLRRLPDWVAQTQIDACFGIA